MTSWVFICRLSLPSLLLLLRLCWVLFLLSTTPLLAMFVRPLLPFLFFLSFRSVGLILWGPLSGSVGVPLTCYVAFFFFPSLGFLRLQAFAPSAAPLLHLALLVAVASLCFLCWSACPADGSSGLCRLAVCSVCCSSCLTRCPSLLCGLCRLEWLWPPPTPA